MMKTAAGGKHFYGYTIGILMNESLFPRIPGEMCNATTWDFPVLFKVVKGANFKKVVEGLKENEDELLGPYIAAAKELEAEGVRAITTNCGFLALFHEKISSQLKIPFFSSSLLLLPLISRMLPPDKIVGVMTVNGDTLMPHHFAAVGAADVPKAVIGMQTEQEFTNFMREDRLTVDVEKCRAEHIKVAARLVADHPNVGAILLECTNMPPYAKAIQESTGLPVFDITSLVRMVHNAFVKHEIEGFM